MQTQIGPEGHATVKLDASGNGTTRVGPLTARERWHAATASFSASTNVLEAQCRIYVGDAAIPANYVDGSLSGSTGDSTGRVDAAPIPKGQFVWAVWTGGDVGSVGTLNVSGMKEL